MRHLLESKELVAPLTEGEEPAESGRAAPNGSLLGGSAPEEFLREVTATLTAFLEDEPVARGLATGEAPSAH
jgi:hypothetical protein